MKTPCQTETVPAFLPLCLVTSWNWNPLENSFHGKTGKEFIKRNCSKYISFSGKFQVPEWGVKDEAEKVTSAFSTFLPDTRDCTILMAYLCYQESQLRSLHFIVVSNWVWIPTPPFNQYMTLETFTVCYGCLGISDSKYFWLGGLNKRFIFSQFWRLEV